MGMIKKGEILILPDEEEKKEKADKNSSKNKGYHFKVKKIDECLAGSGNCMSIFLTMLTWKNEL